MTTSPFNINYKYFEKLLLASILFPYSDNTKNYEKVKNLIKKEDFGFMQHRKIYEEMEKLYSENKEISLAELIERFKNDKELVSYIVDLSSMLPTSDKILIYAKILKKYSVLKKLKDFCYDVYSEIEKCNFEVNVENFIKLFENLKNNMEILIEAEEKERLEKAYDRFVKNFVESLEYKP